MNKSVIRLGIITAVVFILYLWGSSVINGFVEVEESAKGQWAKVESSYQRRADLIPNLVNTVKGYAEHEQETLTAVIEARAKATSVTVDPTNITPQQMAAFQNAQTGLAGALSKLMVVAEKYPDLKANQNFLELQSQLEGTENRINVERNRYSDIVTQYNTSIRKIPGRFFANLFGFNPMPLFQAEQGSEKAPEVKF